MLRRTTSAINWIDAEGKQYETSERTTVFASSIGEGYTVEAGVTTSFEGTAGNAGHLLLIYLEPSRPTVLEARLRGVETTIVQPPNSLFINPPAATFHHRHGFVRWGAVELSKARMRSSLGLHFDPQYDPTRMVVDPALALGVKALLLEAETVQDGSLFMDGLVAGIAAKIVRLAGIDESVLMPERALSNQRLNRAIEMIEDQLGGQIRLDDLAAEAGLSPEHLRREFKRCVGETPHEYMRRRRTERARELLSMGYTIADVAAQLGFVDAPHLNKLFKQRFKMTPAEFVRAFRGEVKPAG